MKRFSGSHRRSSIKKQKKKTFSLRTFRFSRCLFILPLLYDSQVALEGKQKVKKSLGPLREIKGSCEASAPQVPHLLPVSREPPITRPTISLLDQRLSQPLESCESVQIDPLGQWDSVESAPLSRSQRIQFIHVQ